MAYEFSKLTKTRPALFLYEREDGDVVSRIMNENLEHVPYWLYQNEALFLPMTPAALRVSMFNRTVSERHSEGKQKYATRIDYFEDDKIGPFLVIYLTKAGVQMVGKESPQAQKQLYDPVSTQAETQWRGFKKPLKQALKKINLMPVKCQHYRY